MKQSRHSVSRQQLGIAVLTYVLVLAVFWAVVLHFGLAERIGHMPSTFCAFALLLAPYWLFGFGLADSLDPLLSTSVLRVLAPALLSVPYLVYSVARGEFRWSFLAGFALIPVVMSSLMECRRQSQGHSSTGLCWQDVAVLSLAAFPIEFHWLDQTFPHPGLSAMPKLLLVDSILYAYLVVRRLPAIGFDLRFRTRDLSIGIREILFFTPIVISLGLALRFITPHRGIPAPAVVASAATITFFLCRDTRRIVFSRISFQLA